MLNKISINLRVLMLILIPTIIFAFIGYNSFKDFKSNENSFTTTNENLKIIPLGTDLSSNIDEHYTYMLGDLRKGIHTWEESAQKTIAGQQVLLEKLTAFNEAMPVELITPELTKSLSEAQENLTLHHGLVLMFLEGDKGNAETRYEAAGFLMEEQFFNAQEMHRVINAVDGVVFDNVSKNTSSMVDESYVNSKSTILTIVIGFVFILIIGFLIGRSITKPTKNLTNVISRLSNGEFDARAEVLGADEFAKLGTAVNGLLDDRAMTLTQIDAEHQELNQSVFSLLNAVAELSEKDLTIRAAVTEDATGPVADALNLLAQETSDTLKKVKQVAANVNEASNKVNTHLMSINKLAMKEQERAIDTADQMNIMIQKLDSISSSAADTNTMADTANTSTKKAHESVTDTLSGMSDIRTTVQETGKKIKQLGERSQEISHVIEIIETIAERTTLLALNASMQAAAAGDEGKGFSVIAEEIQRLAESSRESTGQISTLVRNIQQETNTTIETMDKTIEQVIDGSVKAADAADQMQHVLETTSELVNAVDQIATASKDQVNISKDLKYKAESILKSTQVTGQELLSLTGLSRNMSEYAQQLVTSVDVFTLEDQTTQDNAPN